MRHITFKTKNTCSRQIDFDLDLDNKIHNLSYIGGCNGNLKAIGKLVEGKNAIEVAKILQGNTCGYKSTSCADQLSQAILKALNEQ